MTTTDIEAMPEPKRAAVPRGESTRDAFMIGVGSFVGLLAVGNISPMLGAAAAALVVGYLLMRGKHRTTAILLLLEMALVMNYAMFLRVTQTLRYPIVITIGLFALIRGTKTGIAKPLIWFLPFVVATLIGLVTGGSGVEREGLMKTLSQILLMVVMFQYMAKLSAFDTVWLARNAVRLYGAIIVVGYLVVPIGAFRAVAVTGRLSGLMGNPDGLGLFVAFLIPLQMALYDVTPPTKRGSLRIMIALTLISALLSGSRGTTSSIAVFFAVRAALRAGWWGRIGVAAAIAVAGAAVIEIQSSPTIITSPLVQRYVRPETIATGSGRFFAWAYAMDYIRSAPTWGRGFAFDELIFDDEHRETTFTDRGGHQGLIHNAYLGILLDAGYVGLAAYIVFVLAVVMSSGAPRLLAPAVIAAAWAAIFEGWALGSLNSYTIMFLLQLVLIPRMFAVAGLVSPRKRVRKAEENGLPRLSLHPVS